MSRFSCPSLKLRSVAVLCCAHLISVNAYDLVPRWGAATALSLDPPALLIQGGKTGSESTYTEAPNSDDLISISLASTFSTSTPPSSLLSSNSTGPPYAWHTFSFLSDDNFLFFGGDATGTEPVKTDAGSAWTLDLSNDSPAFTHEPAAWESEPARRIYHTANSDGQGKVYIAGGLKNDGSGQTYSDVYLFDSASNVFTSLPSLPSGLYHHSAIVLANGTLVVVGGVSISQDTGNPTTIDLSSIYSLDTTSTSPVWDEIDISGSVPSGRRGASLILSSAEDVAFLFGGANSDLTEVLGDGWTLDPVGCSWTQVFASDSNVIGRFDHVAANIGGDQILINGGYGTSGPVDANINIWNMDTNSWQTSFQPSSTTVSAGDTVGVAAAGVSGSAQLVSPDITVYNSNGQSVTSTIPASVGGSRSQAVSGQGSSTDKSSPTGFDDSSGPGGLSASARVGIGLGGAAAALAGLALCYMCARQRHRRKTARSRNGYGGGYGSSEKPNDLYGGGVSGDNASWSKRALASGLGIATRLGGQSRRESYAVLGDMGKEDGHLRGRDGIVIQPPRSPAKAGLLKYSPSKYRRDMLSDEDSRRFPTIQEEDWVLSENDDGKWRPAQSLLGSIHDNRSQRSHRSHHSDETNPFDNEQEPSSPILPPLVIRGGPVPTPHRSTSSLNCDPFDDFRASIPADLDQRETALDDETDLGDSDFLAPPGRVRPLSDQSLPRSYNSRSTSASDIEEGIVGRAELVSHQAPLIYSPEAFEPVKRTRSFFQRMTGMGLSQSGSSRRISQIIPPQPVSHLRSIASASASLDDDDDGQHDEERDLAGEADLMPPRKRYAHASLASLDSVRSMRDMVIVQRQESNSSVEQVVIHESEDGSPRFFSHHRHGTSSITDSSSSRFSQSSLHHDGSSRSIDEMASPLEAEVDFGSDLPDLTLYTARPRTPTRRLADRAASTASRASRMSDQSVASTTTFGTPLTSPQTATSSQGPAVQREPASPISPNTTPRGPIVADFAISRSDTAGPSAPTASPLAKRRPVKELVNSINKRGGSTPISLFSPSSQYSPLTNAPPSPAATPSSPHSNVFLTPEPSPLKSSFASRSGSRPSASASGASPNRPLSVAGSVRSGASVRSGGSIRPNTIYEAVKRERLGVANPDSR